MFGVLADAGTCQAPNGEGCDPTTTLGKVVFWVCAAGIALICLRMLWRRWRQRTPGWRPGRFVRWCAIGLGVCGIAIGLLLVVAPPAGLFATGMLSIALAVFAVLVFLWLVARLILKTGRFWLEVRSPHHR